MNDLRCTVESHGVCRERASWLLSDEMVYGYACNEHLLAAAKAGWMFRRVGKLPEEHLLGPVPIDP